MKILYLTIAALCMTSYCASAQDVEKTSKKDTVITLKEVVVKANKRLIKYEAGQYTVDATLLRKGKINLVDLLSSVPGIIVTDKDIRILGRNDLKVMFNGRIKKIPKDELIGMLKSHEASNVKKIEVIKDPGAKYDAEGNYGILNIITEKKDNYIGGELSDEILYCQKWKNASHLNLNYNHKRFTSSFNAGWTYGKTRYTESSYDYFTDLTRKNSSYHVPKANDYNLTGSIDYMIDSLSTVSLEASYIDTYTKEMGTNEEKSYSAADAFLGKSLSLSNTANPRKNLNMSFYIDRNWDNHNKISLIMDLFRYRNDKNYLFNSRYYNNDNMPNDSTDYLADTSKAHLNGFSSALDYEGLLPWNIKLMTGAKAALSKTDDNLHYDYSTLPVQNDIFSYTENVYAGYAILKKSFGQFSMKVGGRYEYTHTKLEPQEGQATDKNYGRFFPNVHLTYSLEGGSSFDLGINSGTTRPNIKTVNPFIFYISPYSTSKGNPAIEPSHYINLRLNNNFVFRGGEFSAEFAYYKEYKSIAQVQQMDAKKGISAEQWQNAYDLEGGCCDLNLYYSQLSWVKMTVLGELAYNKSSSNSIYSLQSEKSLIPFLYGYFNFIFDKQSNLTGYITANISGRKKDVTGTLNSTYDTSCGLAYSCMKNRLTLKLGVMHLFASKIRGIGYSNDGMSMRFKNNYAPMTISFGASFNFGKDIKSKSRQHSNRDIENRF